MGGGKRDGTIGVFGALSIGVGGIVGGGFFATFGITAAGARGGTPIAFLIGGALALDHRLFLHRADPPLSWARRHGFLHHQGFRDGVARRVDQRAAWSSATSRS